MAGFRFLQRVIGPGWALLNAGCAVNLNGVGAGAVATEGAHDSLPIEERPTSGLNIEDRALLRDSRKLFHDAVGGKDVRREGGLLAGELRVYRWGTNREVPLESYAWNESAGERWHVVRGQCEGEERESCGRNGIRPIDEFYLAEEVTITVVDSEGPGGGEIRYGRSVPLS